MVKIPTFKMNDGREIPALGYGTCLGFGPLGEHSMDDCPKLIEAMSYAIDVGYRHIDTAHLYRVEPEVGDVIRKKIQEGVVKREELFVTTKVWHHMHRAEDVEVSVRGSLRRMQLDYVDLLLIHWPMSVSPDGVDEKIDYLDTWKGFEAVLAKGLTKSIGVSNFNLKQMKRLLANCKVPPAVNSVEVNLTLGQKELVDYCQSQNVVVVAYSPFGKMVPNNADPDSPEPRINNPTMVSIAKKHGKTVTQIALRYLYQRGLASIPKTVTKARVLENVAIFDFELDDADMATLAKFDVGYRTILPYFWQECENYPFEKIKVDKLPEIPLNLRRWKNGYKENID